MRVSRHLSNILLLGGCRSFSLASVSVQISGPGRYGQQFGLIAGRYDLARV
jgi:hypothetical protein